MNKEYIIIVPRVDHSGPTSLAVDIGRMAISKGWLVKLLYLSSSAVLVDVDGFHEVRKFRLRDVFFLKGVVHTHGFRPDFVGWIFSWFPNCITVTTLHGHFPQHLNFDYPKWKVSLAWFFWSRWLYRFDSCVCISKTMLRHYSRVLPKLQGSIAYNFRSLPKVQQKNQLSVDDNISQWIGGQRIEGNVVLAYAGSLTSRKNVISLVRAVREYPNFSLILCGDGPLKRHLEKEICNSKGGQQIFMAGHVASPERIVAMADVLILPSFAEGLPLAILEAAQFGVPSLMSNIAVHRELEANGLGITFNHHNYHDFHRKVLFLVKYRHDKFGQRLRSIWLEKFSQDIGFAQYERLFLSLNSKNEISKSRT